MQAALSGGQARVPATNALRYEGMNPGAVYQRCVADELGSLPRRGTQLI